MQKYGVGRMAKPPVADGLGEARPAGRGQDSRASKVK